MLSDTNIMNSIFLLLFMNAISSIIAKNHHQHDDQQNKEYPIQLNPNKVVFAIDCGSYISTRSFQGFRYQPVT